MTENTYQLDLKKTGELIQKKRETMNMSQYTLSEKSGVSRDTIRRIELGLSSAKISDIYRICDVLKITPLDIAPSRFQHSEKLLYLGSLLAQLDSSKQNEVLDQINSLVAILLSTQSPST